MSMLLLFAVSKPVNVMFSVAPVPLFDDVAVVRLPEPSDENKAYDLVASAAVNDKWPVITTPLPLATAVVVPIVLPAAVND